MTDKTQNGKKQIKKKETRKEIERQLLGLRQIVARSGSLVQLMGSALLDFSPNHPFLKPAGGVIRQEQFDVLKETIEKGRYKEVLKACNENIEKAEKSEKETEKSVDKS